MTTAPAPATTETARPVVTCVWCDNNDRPGQRGDHVVLFACVREHFTARPICAECAERASGYEQDRKPFFCRECSRAGLDFDQSGPSFVALACTRAEWMAMLDRGDVRFCREVTT